MSLAAGKHNATAEAPLALLVDSAVWSTLSVTKKAKALFEKDNGAVEILLNEIWSHFGNPWPGPISSNRNYGAPVEEMDVLMHISNNASQKYVYAHQITPTIKKTSPQSSLNHTMSPGKLSGCCWEAQPVPYVAVPEDSPIEILGVAFPEPITAAAYEALYEVAKTGEEFVLTGQLIQQFHSEYEDQTGPIFSRMPTCTVWYTKKGENKIQVLSGPLDSKQKF